jgi:hypothetical protein
MKRSTTIAKAAAAARELANALAELASETEASGERAECYDSQQLPPRTSRRRFAELCRSGRVPGAYREGRNWVCRREAWRVARARGSLHRAETSDEVTPLAERAEALLRRRGLRLVTCEDLSRSQNRN